MANKCKANGKEKEALDESEFILFYYGLLRRPELDDIFFNSIRKKDASSDTNESESIRMTANQFANFLATEQKVDMTIEECKQFIKHFEPTQETDTLSIEGKFVTV